MTNATFGKLVAYLAKRGYNPSSVLGDKPDGRSRLEIAKKLMEDFDALERIT